MAKRKVLMLGWEFPPMINGGLGIACYGIAKALSKKSDLTVILPKTSQDTYLENVSILGLNNIEVEGKLSYHSEYDKIINKYNAFAKTFMVESGGGVSPYPENEVLMNAGRISTLNGETAVASRQTTFRKGQHVFLGRFQLDEMYGKDVLQKVVEYADYVAALASNLEFDVIHAHDWMTILAGLKVKYETGKPLVLHAHALSYDRAGPDSRGWIYELEKHGLENCDAIIPVSRYTGAIVRDHYGINPNKIFPVHNGIEPVKAFKLEKDFPEKLVLFLGRITSQKGPEFFLDVASKVIAENDDVRFVMAGNGDQFKRIIETGAYRKVGNKFHFTGFLDREKVNKLLAMADVYCMPSVSEPFGLSAVEAAQFGIPAVISKQSGAAEVLTHALVADFWDVELMAEHINNLLTDEALRKSVVENTFKDIETVTWDMAADGILNTYNIVTGNHMEWNQTEIPSKEHYEHNSTSKTAHHVSAELVSPPMKGKRPMTIPEMIKEMEKIMSGIDKNTTSIKASSKGIKECSVTLEKRLSKLEQHKVSVEDKSSILIKSSRSIEEMEQEMERLILSMEKSYTYVTSTTSWSTIVSSTTSKSKKSTKTRTVSSKSTGLKVKVEGKEKAGKEKIKVTLKKKPSSKVKTIVTAKKIKKEASKKGVSSEGADKLHMIEGIGKKIASLLNDAGIMTFKDLSKTKVKAIKAILKEAGPRFKMHDPGTWPKQAKMASKGQWEELKAWQDELDGGREIK